MQTRAPLPALDAWAACGPDDAAAWLADAPCPCWLAGGFSVDVFLGKSTRPHHDLDVGCLRVDWPTLRAAALGSWTVCAARDGMLAPLAPEDQPGPDVHSVWCHPPGASAWHLQVLLDEHEGEDWVYRRDPRVRRPLHALTRRHSREGLPLLEPAITLLYKARRSRPQDEADFGVLAPALESEPRAWLLEGLRLAEPSHPWIRRLVASGAA